MVGVSEEPRLEGFRILLSKRLSVDVLQVGLGGSRETYTGRLEELHDFASVTIDRTVGFVVDDQIEMKRGELFAVAAINHEGLQSRYDNR